MNLIRNVRNLRTPHAILLFRMPVNLKVRHVNKMSIPIYADHNTHTYKCRLLCVCVCVCVWCVLDWGGAEVTISDHINGITANVRNRF